MSRSDNEKQKQIQEKCQIILGNLLREEDNKYCVDCDAKGPRWASWNLGIFLCIRCAGIHRNLGVHISKVKSVNLDTWTPEQVAFLQQMGNSQARAVYEANLPDNFRRPQTDSSLEAFIRSKYEQKKYIAKEWVPPPPPKPAFDIEEDKKREKERKKTRTKSSNQVEIPAIPRHPSSALPRPHGATAPAALTTKKVQEQSEISSPKEEPASDLLMLGDASSDKPCDDIFDAFLSAPRPSADTLSSSAGSSNTQNTSNQCTKSYDTTDLFNEMAMPNSSQNKMTKESILSLYGASQNQVTPQMPPVYGLPAGMYVGQQAYSQVTMARFTGIPIHSVISNGFTSVVPSVPSVHELQQQMSSMQLQGQVRNVPGVPITSVPPTGDIFGTYSTAASEAHPLSGHALSNNLWQ